MTTALSSTARMLDEQLIPRGIRDPLVLGAMRSVPRHLFVPDSLQDEAYADHPVPIGHAQTISQPFIVAFMTQALELIGGERVLEVGTGSGYQSAVLTEIADEVHSMEIVPVLAEAAERRLLRLHYAVRLRVGDGYRGWPEAAPFDAIIVTAAPPRVPEPLIAQLKPGGRLVIPVGTGHQELLRIRKTADGITRESILPVRFVPMTGEAESAE